MWKSGLPRLQVCGFPDMGAASERPFVHRCSGRSGTSAVLKPYAAVCLAEVDSSRNISMSNGCRSGGMYGGILPRMVCGQVSPRNVAENDLCGRTLEKPFEDVKYHCREF